MSNLIQTMVANLKGYTAVNLNKFMTDDGIAWSADILKNNKKVLYAYNRGDGGETSITVHDVLLYKEFAALSDAPDCLAGLIADETENLNAIKAYCKTNTLIQVKGDDPDTYRIIKRQFNDAIREKVTSLYGDDLICILNDHINQLGMMS